MDNEEWMDNEEGITWPGAVVHANTAYAKQGAYTEPLFLNGTSLRTTQSNLSSRRVIKQVQVTTLVQYSCLNWLNCLNLLPMALNWPPMWSLLSKAHRI